jgi:xanthine dehydrogenase accessory factor
MDPSRDFLDRFLHRSDRGWPFVVVTIVDAQGSVPHDVGGKMIVTENGLDFGTIGGGKVEAKAIDQARQMLSHGSQHVFADWNLKADVGMTCGGRVKLFFERFNSQPWSIVIFGAGHVTQALVRLLLTLACRVTCVDPREDWLAKLPTGVETICIEHPKDFVRQMSTDTFVLCMTRGHASDLPVLKEIYSLQQAFRFVGVIGSRTKAAVIRKELLALGIDEKQIQFECPIGLPMGNNHPGEIAVSIAAQLLQVRDGSK